MNDYLLPERIKKGETAGKRLKQMDWPANLHQKLIDKRYNGKFKSVSPTPATKLPKTADLLIPKLTPREYKKENKEMKKLASNAIALGKMRMQTEKAANNLIQNRNKDQKMVTQLKSIAMVYNRDAVKLVNRCVESAKACGGAGFAHAALIGNYKKLMKEADALEKALDKSDADYVKKLKAIGIRMRLLKKAEEEMVADVAGMFKYMIGMYIVMP